eukprot:m.127409 g.127409  ORF g.127409 m.127409 type:complete len:459 (+) comp15800_c0_seq5:1121-2497(+)
MEARFDTICILCKQEVERGSLLWPSLDERQRRVWQHETCAIAAGLTLVRPVCKHWKRKGQCHYQDECFFAHPADVALEVQARLAAQPTTLTQPDRHGEVHVIKQNKGPGRRNKVRNDFRASTFRRFLIDTFGLARLAEGSGVLDVASGKGEVAFELATLNRLSTTCLEPRLLELNGFENRVNYGFYFRNRMFDKYNAVTTPEAARTAPQPIHHIRCLLMLGADDEPTCFKDAEAWQVQQKKALVLKWDRKGLHGDTTIDQAPAHVADQTTDTVESTSVNVAADVAGAEPASANESELELHQEAVGSGSALSPNPDVERPALAAPSSSPTPDLSNFQTTAGTKRGRHHPQNWSTVTPVTDLAQARQRVAEAAIVVGMHPDGAAGPLVRYALKHRKPFALVPCCVYAKDFPARKLKSGVAVQSYRHLLQYLKEMDETIREIELPFEGKNVCLYWDPMWSS